MAEPPVPASTGRLRLAAFEHLVAPAVVGLIVIAAQFFLQPLIQERIASRSELWIQKRALYATALELVDKQFGSLTFGGQSPINRQPTTDELNAVYRQLFLYADDKEIITMFRKFMDASIENYNSPYNRGRFLIRLRQDLGKSATSLSADTIPYFRQPQD